MFRTLRFFASPLATRLDSHTKVVYTVSGLMSWASTVSRRLPRPALTPVAVQGADGRPAHSAIVNSGRLAAAGQGGLAEAEWTDVVNSPQ
jgi:hypothetical protein